MQSTRQPSMRPVIVNLAYVLILLPFVMLLQACGHKPQKQPADLPKLPLPPSLSTPTPSETYSLSARRDMEMWQKRLMDTEAMRKPSSKPGR